MSPTPNPTPAAPRPGFKFSILYVLAAVWLTLFVTDFVRLNRAYQMIPYSQFLSLVKAGKVAEVMIGNERIEGTFKPGAAPAASTADGKAGAEAPSASKGGAPATPAQRVPSPPGFVTNKVPDDSLVARLTDGGVKFSGVHESTFWRDLLSWVIPALVLGAVWMFVMNRMGQGMARGGGMLPIGKSKAKVYVETDLKTRFEDVAGVDEAKEELREVVNFLKNPTHYSKLGGRMPKGVLLVGAPGTGKTLLARAVAGEAGVPFFSINGSEFVELFVGLGAARVRDLFQQARGQAPCIIFIDELDALGKARGLNAIAGSSNDEKEQTLNQLLAEMDGFDPSIGVVLVAATNRPEVLDPALLRAGRFDRQILVDRPDRGGRVMILGVHMKKIKYDPAVSLDTLASLTAGFSGADLANLVNEAALIATRREAERVELRDFTAGIERIVAGLERKGRVLSPKDKRRVAYHEMGHAVLALAFGDNEAVHKVSIIPRGIGALGYTFRRPVEDSYLMSRRELENKLAIALGGRAAESTFFEDISTGAADDLDKATDIARAMITRYGMSRGLGLAVYEKDSAPLLGTGSAMRSFDYSDETARAIDEEVKRLLNQANDFAVRVIEHYKPFVEECAEVLLTRETLDEEELKRLWQKHARPQLVDTRTA